MLEGPHGAVHLVCPERLGAVNREQERVDDRRQVSGGDGFVKGRDGGPVRKARVIIVGVGDEQQMLARVLANGAPPEYRLFAFVDDGVSRRPKGLGGEVIGAAEDLYSIASRAGAKYVAVPDVPLPKHLWHETLRCASAGIRVERVVDLYTRLTGRVPLDAFSSNWPTRDVPRVLGWLHETAIRALDVLVGTVGLALMACFLPLLALAIKMESPGPIFYLQERVGRHGRVFRMWKFRTMRKDAEASGPQWAEDNDPRVTRLGRILRRMRIDEMPQFINVLKGDMSIVGPRPERPEFVAVFRSVSPAYDLRHAVRPGLTGWAQVERSYASSVEDGIEKLEYDLYYLSRRSLWLNLFIMAQTPAVLISGRGAR